MSRPLPPPLWSASVVLALALAVLAALPAAEARASPAPLLTPRVMHPTPADAPYSAITVATASTAGAAAAAAAAAVAALLLSKHTRRQSAGCEVCQHTGHAARSNANGVRTALHALAAIATVACMVVSAHAALSVAPRVADGLGPQSFTPTVVFGQVDEAIPVQLELLDFPPAVQPSLDDAAWLMLQSNLFDETACGDAEFTGTGVVYPNDATPLAHDGGSATHYTGVIDPTGFGADEYFACWQPPGAATSARVGVNTLSVSRITGFVLADVWHDDSVQQSAAKEDYIVTLGAGLTAADRVWLMPGNTCPRLQQSGELPAGAIERSSVVRVSRGLYAHVFSSDTMRDLVAGQYRACFLPAKNAFNPDTSPQRLARLTVQPLPTITSITPATAVPVALFTVTLNGQNMDDDDDVYFVQSASCDGADLTGIVGHVVKSNSNSVKKVVTVTFPAPGAFWACVLAEHATRFARSATSIQVLNLYENRALAKAGTCCETDSDCASTFATMSCVNRRCTMDVPPWMLLPVPVCTTKYDCGAGQECRYGQCVPATQRDSNTFIGFACTTKYECYSPELECVSGGCALLDDVCNVVQTATPESGTWEFIVQPQVTQGLFVEGPGTPPLGTGSAALVVGSGGSVALVTRLYAGVRLADMYRLNFGLFKAPISTADYYTFELRLAVDYGQSGQFEPPDQGFLVFNPTKQVPRPPLPNMQWLRIDAISPAARWFATAQPGQAVCSQSKPCTWAQVLAAFPNARIRPAAVPTIEFRLTGLQELVVSAFVDDFQINTEQWSFEPSPALAAAGECCAGSNECNQGQECGNQRCMWTSTQYVPHADPLGTQCTRSSDCTGDDVCSYGRCVAADTPPNRNQIGRLCSSTDDCQSSLLQCVQGQCVVVSCVV